MNSEIRLSLHASDEQQRKLAQLQQAFAQVCNALAPVVQETRIWNRVALHHLTYRKLRQQFPDLGSQMVCNAIYAVSRASRLVFQTPNTPFHHSRLAGKPLPLLRFTDQCPVYFDRHTLSIKDGMASMFTLDGRIRFELVLSPEAEQAFRERKLWEILLTRRGDVFVLTFRFHADVTHASGSAQDASDEPGESRSPQPAEAAVEWPPYLSVQAAA